MLIYAHVYICIHTHACLKIIPQGSREKKHMECISCYLGLQYQQETSQQVLSSVRWQNASGFQWRFVYIYGSGLQKKVCKREFGYGLMHPSFHLAMNCSLVIFLFRSASVWKLKHMFGNSNLMLELFTMSHIISVSMFVLFSIQCISAEITKVKF